MDEVRITIDGVDYMISKKMFADMMYACEIQADVWSYNNSIQNNDELASKWNAVTEQAIDFKEHLDISD